MGLQVTQSPPKSEVGMWALEEGSSSGWTVVRAGYASTKPAAWWQFRPCAASDLVAGQALSATGRLAAAQPLSAAGRLAAAQPLSAASSLVGVSLGLILGHACSITPSASMR